MGAVHLRPTSGGGGSSPAGTPTYALTDATVANHYAAPAGTLRGNVAGFTVSAYVRINLVLGGEEHFFDNFRKFTGNGGWYLGRDSTRFRFGIADSTGAEVSNFTDGEFPLYELYGKLWLVTMSFDGVTATLYLNGELVRTLTPSGGYGIADVLTPPMIGRSENPTQASPCVHSDVLGCGYVEAPLTEAQVIEHYLACEAASAFVDGGASWDSWWTFENEATAPATLADQNAVTNFTEQGTCSVVGIQRPGAGPPGPASPADVVTYDNATSGLAAANVQAAIDEIVATPTPGLPDVAYISNRWYDLAGIRTGASHTTRALTAGELRLALCIPTRTFAMNAIGIEVSTAGAGSTVTLVIFDADADGLPQDRIYESTPLSSATTGDKVDSVTPVPTLTKGRIYYVGTLALGANPTVRARQTYDTYDIGGRGTGASFATTAFNSMRLTGQTSVPASWPTFAAAQLQANYAAPAVLGRAS